MTRLAGRTLAAALTLGGLVSAQSTYEYQPTLPPVASSKNFALGPGSPYEGLTLIQPMFDTTARLIDTSGNVVKSFEPA